jgi:hypothetical protein
VSRRTFLDSTVCAIRRFARADSERLQGHNFLIEQQTNSFKRVDFTVPTPILRLSTEAMLVLARFETHLCWAPSLDGCAGFVRMSLANRHLERFEWTAF